MTQDETTKASRQDRLRQALRENLKRRKSQLRGRSGAPAATDADAAVAPEEADDAGTNRSHAVGAAKPVP
ncbi:MAG: hypothetical protein AB7I42_18260 [Bradyrhizobium sp.]